MKLCSILPLLKQRCEKQWELNKKNKTLQTLANNPFEQAFVTNANPLSQLSADKKLETQHMQHLHVQLTELEKNIEDLNKQIEAAFSINGTPEPYDALTWRLIHVLDTEVEKILSQDKSISIATAYLTAIENLPKNYFEAFSFQSNHEMGFLLSINIIRLILTPITTLFLVITYPFTNLDPNITLGDLIKHAWGVDYYSFFKKISSELPSIRDALNATVQSKKSTQHEKNTEFTPDYLHTFTPKNKKPTENDDPFSSSISSKTTPKS